MAQTKYTYSIQSDFPNHKVASDRLTQEIQASSITIALDYIETAGDVCDIWFKAELSTDEQTALVAILAAHSGDPLAAAPSAVSLAKTDGTPIAISSDGRLIQRLTVATPGRSVHTRFFNFKTASPGSLVNRTWADVDHADTAYKMFDAGGQETADSAQCVKTVIDFESHRDMEIAGGGFYIDPTVAGGSSGEWYAAAVAAPGVPAEQGGQIEFASKVDLEMITDGWFDIDGRSVMFIQYDPVYHSGTIRFIFWHPVGVQKRALVYMECFK